MSLPRKAKAEEKRPPCVICSIDAVTRPDGETWVCGKHEAEWCRHVDALVNAGTWPIGKWHEVWTPWIAERRKRSAA